MADLQAYLERTQNEDKRTLLRDQHKQLHETNCFHCPCGWRRHYSMGFRCLYCGMWMCAGCAEVHFGRTRREHDEQIKMKEASDDLHRKMGLLHAAIQTWA